jgi:hypothetical protein
MLSGKGMYIWYAAICEGGDLFAIRDRALELGLSRVELKIADGADLNKYVAQKWGDEVIGPLIDVLTDAGIDVWGWQYTYCHNPAREAEHAIFRMRRFPKLKGFIIDAEHECKINSRNVELYAKTIRAGIKKPVGLTSYRYPSLHPELPWRKFFPYVDFLAPQVYWEFSHNPTFQLNTCIKEYRSMGTSLPIYPIGSAYSRGAAVNKSNPKKYWEATVDDLNGFNTAAKNLNLPAISWWYWTSVVERQDYLKTIISHDWGKTPTVGVPEKPKMKHIVLIQTLRSRKGPGLSHKIVHRYSRNEIVEIDWIEDTDDKDVKRASKYPKWAKLANKDEWVCTHETGFGPYIRLV